VWQKPVVSASEGDAANAGDCYRTLMDLAEQGELRPVIDTVLPFEQIVDAYRRVDSGHKVGSIVLTFG
jgi:NADPH:quinone reductase-like Zn-dependent oxidoreductase